MSDWAMPYDVWLDWMADKPVLMRLYEEQVFSLGFLKDGKIGVTENCDNWFNAELTKDEVRKLAAELLAICEEALDE